MTLCARLRVSRLLAVCILLVSPLLSFVAEAQAVIAPAVAVGDAAYNFFGIKPVAAALSEGASGVVSWNGVLKYGGVATVAAASIYYGLNWFYDEVQRESSTSIDQWYLLTGDMAWLPPRWDGFQNQKIVCTNITVGQEGAVWYGNFPGQTTLKLFSSEKHGTDNFIGSYPNEAAMGAFIATLTCGPAQRPSLIDWESGNYQNSDGTVGTPHPDVQQGLQKIGRDFMRDKIVPDAAANRATPGITFQPKPNSNQWRQSPPFIPGIDTDGDGWSDQGEVTVSPHTDPSDPYSKPPGIETDPNANPNGTCKSGFARVGGTGACLPQTDPNADPNANPDGTCKSGFARVGGTGACLPQTDPNADPNANPDGTCKAGFVKPAVGACEPEKKVCEVGQKLVNGACVPDPLVLQPAPAFPDPLAPVQLAVNKFEADVKALQNVASTKFPFGFSSWIPTGLSVDNSCTAVITIEFGALGTPSFDLCQIAGVQLAHNNIRPLLLFVLAVLFILMCSRIVGQS
jgi:hypothetical protein